jgi:hypothetical protein
MRRLSMSALIGVSLASGCVVYDNDCPSEYDDNEQGLDHDRPDYDDTDGDEAPAPSYSLDPATAQPGDVFIASLTSDQAINYEAIVEIEFLTDDVTPCTFQARADELLVTVGVQDFAEIGPVDMLIVFEDGTTDYATRILTISLDDGSGDDGDDGDDGGGGGTGGGGTGGNDDGGICG